ncbi:MAG: hypothetical protein ACI9EW_003565 [Cellvibrionaceae bacterium]|jgi:uncharacterized protein YPO0396
MMSEKKEVDNKKEKDDAERVEVGATVDQIKKVVDRLKKLKKDKETK